MLVRKVRLAILSDGSRKRTISQGDSPGAETGVERMAEVHDMRLRSEDPEIAAGIDHAAARAGTHEHLCRAIDGESLGDSAKIDEERAPKMHRAIGSENDVAPVSGGGDIERAIGFTREISSGQQDAPGPRVHAQRFTRRSIIEPADVADRIVKIHEPMDCAHRRKCLVDGGVQTRFINALRGDFHEGPKERTGATNLT
jgi:hypothetical protein